MAISIFTKYAVKKAISKLVRNNPSQLTIREYSTIAKTVIEKEAATCWFLV